MFSETPLTSRPSLGSGSIEGALLADINGDGRLDLITWPNQRSASDLGTFYVSLGRTAGGFGPAEGYTVSKVIRGIMAVDLNQDGAYDLFLSLWTGGDALQRDPPYLELWLGSTDGHLLPAPANPASDCALPLALADVSGDGKPDLVAYSNKGGALEVYLSDSPGSFHPSGSYATTLSGRLLVMDWNGDGFPDLVLAGSPLQLFYNRGDGTFDDVVDCGLAVGWDVVADFNHDGHMDLATYRNYGTEVDVLLGQGACRFAPAAVYAASGGSGPCSPLEAADMDGDGQLDLLCANQGNMLTGLLGNPDGSFQAGAPIALGAAARKIVVGDVTGDQRPDLVTIDDKGQVSIWENTCP